MKEHKKKETQFDPLDPLKKKKMEQMKLEIANLESQQ